MATLYAFRGYRFDPNNVGRIADVLTQPYDKIPEELKQVYLKRHPNNIVRVIRNENYAEAAAFLSEWEQKGILRRDDVPSIYAYEQEFDFEGETLRRLGVISLISLDDSDLAVKGHERVLSGPLEDRLNLIRATESNEGLIFTLYSDPAQESDDILSGHKRKTPPAIEAVDDLGVVHRVWPISDSEVIEPLHRCLKDKALYIADGHHRYQTSVLFNEECRRMGWRPAAVESFDKRMVALFNMENRNVKILATHRAVHNLESFETRLFLDRLEGCFDVCRYENEQQMLESVKSKGHQFGMMVGDSGESFTLALKPGILERPDFMAGINGPLRVLDVTILHEGILRAALGLGPEELASQQYVDYFRDWDALSARLRQGRYNVGFYLNPTTLEEVRKVSEVGDKMPQKSTDFFPKLLTGLVLMRMEIERN